MQGKIERYDSIRGQGEIFLDVGLSFPFTASDVRGPCILERGDQIQFDVRDRGQGPEAFDVRPNWVNR